MAKLMEANYKTLITDVCHDKRARCSYQHLIRHRQVGGVGLPDITDYFPATKLAQLRLISDLQYILDRY